MIEPHDFQNVLERYGFDFYSGVPDSILSFWLSELERRKKVRHIKAISECESIALSAGYYLKTGKPAVAYMQNSGLCKAINPLISLCDREVYSIPVLLIISWRGMPGTHDEPQHKKMGKITINLLKTLDIDYLILGASYKEICQQIEKAVYYLDSKKQPFAIIVKKDSFVNNKMDHSINNYQLNREEAIKEVLNFVKQDDKIISTTGKISRELYDLRETNLQSHKQDFYMVGSMGCASALGLAISLFDKGRIFIFDGDGSVLMQMGSLATIGHVQPNNLYHIIFDNESYESTGNQESVSKSVDFERVALGCRYRKVKKIVTKKAIRKNLMTPQQCPCLYVIKVRNTSRKDLGRPKSPPADNKISFMRFINDEN